MLDEKILKILRTKSDEYVSGEELCKLADISRAAIWKHIEKLRGEGYEIDASPHLGYRLARIPDSLIPAEIGWNLNTKILGGEMVSYRKVDSTNDLAYSLAEKGAKEGLVVLADEQTSGKGRHGRAWASPPKGGIYLSCILRPDIPPNDIPQITLLAAVSVVKAIRDFTSLNAMIKWPNDILINRRKVCGILTEMKAEQDRVGFVVLGIGVNVNTEPRLLPKGASSLRNELRGQAKEESLSRIELTKRILISLEEYYNVLRKAGFGPIIAQWKGLTDMLGSRIRVALPNKTFEGLAHDIENDGSLTVRLDSGILEKVSSGDILMVR